MDSTSLNSSRPTRPPSWVFSSFHPSLPQNILSPPSSLTTAIHFQNTPSIPEAPTNPKSYESNEIWKGISIQRAVATFGLGFATGFGGLWALNKLTDTAKGAASQKLKDPIPMNEVTTFFNHTNAGAIIRLFITEPAYRDRLLAYMGASVLGFLGDNILQGGQEAWVRQEESRIRFHLLSCMTGIFQKTIQIKQQHDNELRQIARREITQILQTYHGSGQISPKALDEMLQTLPSESPPSIENRFIFEPAHRTQRSIPTDTLPYSARPPAPLRFGDSFSRQTPLNQSPSSPTEQTPSPWSHQSILDVGLFGLGALAGGVSRMFSSAINQVHVLREGALPKTNEGVFVTGLENLFLILNNKRLLLGALFMVALARVGQTFLNGVREIEVTRLNSRTEFNYQQYRMEHLDPRYHRIAEEEALSQALQHLKTDMPLLIHHPDALKSRIQSIFSAIGQQSAPKYWSMSPPVGLVVARS